MHSKLNDCSVCAVMNALLYIGVSVNREEAELATDYDEHGGFPDIGLHKLADKLGLIGERYPKSEDIAWADHPTKSNVKYASPDLNKSKIFTEFVNRLRDGWVAVTAIKWENTEYYHAVALIGTEDNKIKVCCSVKGIYLASEDLLLVTNDGTMNGIMTTYWVRKQL